MADVCSLFVYGSLMRGLMHHQQLRGASHLGSAVVPAHYLVLYEETYPALVAGLPHELSKREPSFTRVQGELYAVGALHLAALDAFEECPDLYQRTLVRLEDGRSAQAYTISAERALGYAVIPGAFRSSPWAR